MREVIFKDIILAGAYFPDTKGAKVRLRVSSTSSLYQYRLMDVAFGGIRCELENMKGSSFLYFDVGDVMTELDVCRFIEQLVHQLRCLPGVNVEYSSNTINNH